MQRRRKKVTDREAADRVPLEELPKLDTYCGVCLAQGLREVQRQSPGGAVCKFGHGGADGVPIVEAEEVRARHEAADDEQFRARARDGSALSAAGFVARGGDTLTVHFGGASLQIVQYNNVELDSATYVRRLEPGDDPAAEFARVYAYLRGQCLDRARAKLRDYADELRGARRRAQGDEG